MTRPTKGQRLGRVGTLGGSSTEQYDPRRRKGWKRTDERGQRTGRLGDRAEVTSSEARMDPAEVALGGTPAVLEQQAVGRVSRSRLADRAEKGGRV